MILQNASIKGYPNERRGWHPVVEHGESSHVLALRTCSYGVNVLKGIYRGYGYSTCTTLTADKLPKLPKLPKLAGPSEPNSQLPASPNSPHHLVANYSCIVLHHPLEQSTLLYP
jgi:hypothetical protein